MKLTDEQILKLNDPHGLSCPSGHYQTLEFARAIESLVAKQYEAMIASLENPKNITESIYQVGTFVKQAHSVQSPAQDWKTRCDCNMKNIADRYPEFGCLSCGKPKQPAPLAAQVQEHPDTKAINWLQDNKKQLCPIDDGKWFISGVSGRYQSIREAIDASIQSAKEQTT